MTGTRGRVRPAGKHAALVCSESDRRSRQLGGGTSSEYSRTSTYPGSFRLDRTLWANWHLYVSRHFQKRSKLQWMDCGRPDPDRRAPLGLDPGAPLRSKVGGVPRRRAQGRVHLTEVRLAADGTAHWSTEIEREAIRPNRRNHDRRVVNGLRDTLQALKNCGRPHLRPSVKRPEGRPESDALAAEADRRGITPGEAAKQLVLEGLARAEAGATPLAGGTSQLGALIVQLEALLADARRTAPSPVRGSSRSNARSASRSCA